MNLPKKKYFRQHAHSNPYADHLEYPASPYLLDWNKIYRTNGDISPEYLDLGCGYGSFLIFLSETFPDKYIIGMEIRKKVFQYVDQKIHLLQDQKKLGMNCAVLHSNALLFFLNYFKKSQLEKIFCLFPDPHFKKRKQKVRIICKQMLDQMAYTLKIGGRIYISTDVKELFESMVNALESHRLFIKVNDSIDELFPHLVTKTDESKRAGKKADCVYAAIYQRIKSEE